MKSRNQVDSNVDQSTYWPRVRVQWHSIDVNAIRKKTGKCQEVFADAMGVSLSTYRNWEQHRRKPTGPALVLLKLIDIDPEIVIETLRSAARS